MLGFGAPAASTSARLVIAGERATITLSARSPMHWRSG
jgi:hypothetical protein